mmetsp:Transcript_70748/g.223493  ORF Transcript_70748/g.223493 Transcript_70748/m.223493 type:complete len:214 (-) Transcript_70748:203-844(-)
MRWLGRLGRHWRASLRSAPLDAQHDAANSNRPGYASTQPTIRLRACHTQPGHSRSALAPCPGPAPGRAPGGPPPGAACAAHLPSGGVRTTAGAPSSPPRRRLVMGLPLGCAFDPGDHLRDPHARRFARIEIDGTRVPVVVDPERAMAGVKHDGAAVRSVGQVACRGDGVGAAGTTAVVGHKVLGPRVDAVSVDAIGAHHMHPLGLKLVSCRSA